MSYKETIYKLFLIPNTIIDKKLGQLEIKSLLQKIQWG